MLGLTAIVVAAFVLAGCDKCGDRIKLNAPSLPKACGDNADPMK